MPPAVRSAASKLPAFIRTKAPIPPRKTAAKAKKPRSQASSAVRGDVGTLELRQHSTVLLEPRDRSSTGHVIEIGARVRDQTPLDRYHQRGELSPDPDRNTILFAAGERLRTDFYYSGRGPKVGSTLKPRLYSGGGEASADDMAVRKEASERRFKAAMAHFGSGPLAMSARSILTHVCLCEGTTGDWALANGDNRRGGLDFLQKTLFQLAFHYGMVKVFERT